MKLLLHLAEGLRGERAHVAEALELLERVGVEGRAARRGAVGAHLKQPPPLVALRPDPRLGGGAPMQHARGGGTDVLCAGEQRGARLVLLEAHREELGHLAVVRGGERQLGAKALGAAQQALRVMQLALLGLGLAVGLGFGSGIGLG